MWTVSNNLNHGQWQKLFTKLMNKSKEIIPPQEIKGNIKQTALVDTMLFWIFFTKMPSQSNLIDCFDNIMTTTQNMTKAKKFILAEDTVAVELKNS